MIKKLRNFFDSIIFVFKRKKTWKLGVYGPPNSGKCVTPETDVIMQNGEIKPIKEIFDEAREKVGKFNNFKDFNELYLDIRELNLILPSFNHDNLKITPKKVSFVYAQKYKGDIYNIETRSGRKIRVTPEHPLIRISNNGIEKIKSSELKEKDCVAIAKNVALNSDLLLPQVAEGFNISSNGMVQAVSKFHNPKSISVPSYIDENLVRFVGYTLSEGYHIPNRIKFSNCDKNSLNDFEFLSKKLFNLDCIKRVNKGVHEREINSKSLTDYLSNILNFNPGTSGIKKIPSKLMGMPDNLTAELLKVLFDMEGYVPDLDKKTGPEIEFTSKSKQLVEEVQLLLNRFGIVGRFKEKIVNGERYYRLFIAGSDNHRRFREKIGFNINHKKERLDKLCNCGLKRNRFYLPIMDLLDNIRKESGLFQREFFLDSKQVARMKRDNRITYHRIVNMAKKTDNKFIKRLAESDNLWDEIKEIKKEDYDGYVYDLTIEDNHTFLISNGLIAHNTTLANRICQDWLGETMGKVSKIPHETRKVQMKEKIKVQSGNKTLNFNLIDTPGIATKIDYEDFIKSGLKKREAQVRAKEATKGVIEAIKWLDEMDCVLVVLDSTQDPYSQVNITIIGNLAARDIPVLIIGNKMDLKRSDVKRIEAAFPQYRVVGLSAEYGDNIDNFYNALFKLVR